MVGAGVLCRRGGGPILGSLLRNFACLTRDLFIKGKAIYLCAHIKDSICLTG